MTAHSKAVRGFRRRDRSTDPQNLIHTVRKEHALATGWKVKSIVVRAFGVAIPVSQDTLDRHKGQKLINVHLLLDTLPAFFWKCLETSDRQIDQLLSIIGVGAKSFRAVNRYLGRIRHRRDLHPGCRSSAQKTVGRILRGDVEPHIAFIDPQPKRDRRVERRYHCPENLVSKPFVQQVLI